MRKLILATVSCMLIASSSPQSHAQVAGGGATGDVVEQVISETWARHYWEWYDTGQVSDDAVLFGLTAGPPTLNPIQDGLLLFDNLSGQTAPTENQLWQDITSSADAYHAFRHYTMTGQLVTPITSDLSLDHASLATANPDIFNTTTSNGFLVSKVDKKKKKDKEDGDGQVSPPDGDGDGIPDEWQDFWDDLNDAVDNSGLEDLDLYIPDTYYDGGSWWNPFDNTPESPGFDCDDYSTAMIHYLDGQFPDANFSYIFVYWSGFGHSMVLIEQDGTYFIVDPQTGQVVGPFDSVEDAEDGVREILGNGYNYDTENPPDVTMNPSDSLPSGEPPPFYTDPNILRQFQEALEEVNDNDADDYTPPGM